MFVYHPDTLAPVKCDKFQRDTMLTAGFLATPDKVSKAPAAAKSSSKSKSKNTDKSQPEAESEVVEAAPKSEELI
jgi:hypothetical protein